MLEIFYFLLKNKTIPTIAKIFTKSKKRLNIILRLVSYLLNKYILKIYIKCIFIFNRKKKTHYWDGAD